MRRRSFLGNGLMGLLSWGLGVGALRAITGCGTATSTGGNCLANGTSVDIASNHGHVLTVSAADVSAGVSKTYDIMGTANHTHSVTLSPTDFTTLAGNTGLATTSSTTGHSHAITINCA